MGWATFARIGEIMNGLLGVLGSGWKTSTGVLMLATAAAVKAFIAIANPDALEAVSGLIEWLEQLGTMFAVGGIGHKLVQK